MNTNTAATSAKPRPSTYTLRIKFGKLGSLGYISHLDLMRTMTKLLVRARLPLAYSEGFNPIPRLTFSPPLSLGITSSCELVDVRLTGVSSDADIDAFSRAVTDGLPSDVLPVYNMYLPSSDLSGIAYASYDVTFVSPAANAEVAENMKRILADPAINIMKKTKSGIKEVNIAPLIHSSNVSLEDGCIRLSCLLGAGSDSFLNPMLLAKHLSEQVGLASGEPISEYYTIHKNAMYAKDMQLFE